jgi:aminopeptidase N
MKLFRVLFLLGVAVATISGCDKNSKIENGVSLELANERKERLSDIRYHLSFKIPANIDASIEATNTIYFSLNDSESDLLLDFREAESKLHSITINGQATPIDFKKEHIIISKKYLVDGDNEIHLSFEAGETSLNRNEEFLYTLFVPDRARTAFPLFDQPNLKARYTLTLTTPSHWEAISNGPLAEKTTTNGNTVWAFEESDLISSYLFSFVAGEFERVSQTVNGREMTMLHRETDEEKVARNLDDIFELHGTALEWLEDYTGIDYPFKKFDFALIPSFQYGGMEHVGAIQYRASSLFLDEDPSESRQLSRASLIAHETAHMWFGDLVTMDWFNDVWTKEVFANFMAAKIVHPSFPKINHELNFLVRHYPSAYSVDRTSGANPIRQELPNLNEAGQMYGAIIYNKAPIMMRQLELLVGEENFQKGMQDYLSTYSFKNATWPDLISILNKTIDRNLSEWSQVWVNTAGRPHFSVESDGYTSLILHQEDPTGNERIWSQQFDIKVNHETGNQTYSILSDKESKSLKISEASCYKFLNSNGYGYGLFPLDFGGLMLWNDLTDLERGTVYINLYENMLEGFELSPESYLSQLYTLAVYEDNQLLLNLGLGHVRSIFWNFLTAEQRVQHGPRWEKLLWDEMIKEKDSSRKKILFNTYQSIAMQDSAVEQLMAIWKQDLEISGLTLSENDYVGLASNLAIKVPAMADTLVQAQLNRIKNPDRKKRFEFIAPTLSRDEAVRDQFFESLKQEENRAIESWVLGALGNLHHPLRTHQSDKYILPSLELLQEIQVTGDIFFPKRWLDQTLSNHSSDRAVKTVRDFLENRPNYNKQLRMKILQASDTMLRANRIKKNTD